MKVLVASFDEVPSFKGASTHILSGLRQVVRSHEIVLCSLGNTQLPPQPGFRHIPLVIREENYLRRALLFRNEIGKLLRKERPDLVHIRSPWEGRPAIELGYKTIFEANGLASVELRYRYRSLSDNVKRFLEAEERFCFSRCSCIITPTRLVGEYIRRHHAESFRTPLYILPNGYDPVAHSPTASKVRSPDRQIHLVYIGTLSPWQGVTWSLRALREFGDTFALDVFTPTNGPLRSYFEKRVARLGLKAMVSIHEPLDRMSLRQRLINSDLGFAPLLKTERNTEQGGFPIKLLDYLAHGLPVLASDLRVNRQIIGGHNGFLFQPSSQSSLREALASIAHKPSLITELREGVHESLGSQWTWHKYGNELQKVYFAAVSQNAGLVSELSHSVPV